MKWVREPAEPWSLRATPANAAERALAEAGARRTAAARARVEASLGGFRLPALAATDCEVLSLLALDDRFVAALASEALLDRYVATGESTAPFLAAVPGIGPNERSVPPTVELPTDATVVRPTVLPAGLEAELRAGRTFIVHRIDQYDRATLRSFAEDLELVAGVPVGVNCYLSRNDAEGFGRHWDDHDVLVLQVEGRKLWEVHQPTHLSPVRGYVHDELAGPPTWSGVLEPGQGLFIPRGWAHRVDGLDERSVHLTVGVHRPSVLEVVESLRWGLDERPAPTDADGFRAWLAAEAADGPALATRALATVRGEVPVRPQQGLAATERWLAQPDPSALAVLGAGAPVFVGEPDERRVLLRWSAMHVELDAGEAAALAAWPDVPGDAPRLDQLELGSQLLRAGLARVRPEGASEPRTDDAEADR